MGLMDKLSNSVSTTAKNIGKKSTQIVEVSKLNASVRKRDEELMKQFEELGQYVYIRLKKLNYVTREELEETIRLIEQIEADIKTLEKLILNVRNINYCERCDIELEDETRYCPLCGRSVGR